MKPCIIHEDDYLLAIDKPAGMPSVSLKEGEKGTLASWILERYPGQALIGRALEAGLTHRLDNETSGIIVAAKTTPAYNNLRKQFGEGLVSKTYLALVLGRPKPNGKIELPIAHHPRKKKMMMVCESEDRSSELRARPAETRYEVLESYVYKGRSEYSLLLVSIKSGVRHQIRTHLASIGHPIVGDSLYMNRKERMADILKPARHLLHARALKFQHPSNVSEVQLESPVPEDFKETLIELTQG